MALRLQTVGLACAFVLSPFPEAVGAAVITTVHVPAGSFAMGSQRGATWEQPRHTVKTPQFEMATKPVTNAEFRAFRPSHRSPGDDSETAPVTGVSWFDAQAYSSWLSEHTGRPFVLPTEAWWEKAVRGGLEDQTYPWGDEPPLPAGSDLRKAPPRPNPYGIYAITYNLWEWSADWYAADYYSKSPQNDPRGPKDGAFRVLRGGGFRADPSSATCFSRGSARPETASPYITFRVAVDVAETPVVSEARPVAPPRAQPQPQPAPPAAASGGGAPLDVSGFDVAEEPGQVVVKVATSEAAQFKTMQLGQPERLVVDLPGARLSTGSGSGKLQVGKLGVEGVRYSQFQLDPPAVRVVVDMAEKLDFQIENWPAELRIIIRPKP